MIFDICLRASFGITPSAVIPMSYSSHSAPKHVLEMMNCVHLLGREGDVHTAVVTVAAAHSMHVDDDGNKDGS